jgi:hypothetical protein
MNMPSRNRRAFHAVAALGWAVGVFFVVLGPVQAASIPANLGAGLYGLVAARQGVVSPGPGPALQAAPTEEMLTVGTENMMRDEADRVLVNIVVDGLYAYDEVRAAVSAVPGMSITAEDPSYRAGIIEGFVPEDSLVTLAKTKGVSAVHAVSRPEKNIGSVTQQGVVQHRVDQLPANLDGTGITIGILSDSYNTAANFLVGGTPLTIREAQDIASCDLPGTGNPCGNTQPVVVLKDFSNFPNPNVFDEGRGMAQLIHDMAPKARLGFATADDGEVAFANNIRALGGIQGLPSSNPDFAAQIIVDDVQYFDEGMFADTIVAQAVDDVAALGVSYFSSAGNTAPTQGYASDFRLVPVGPGATAGTNINLAAVPPGLYQGGFHNFRSDGGQDIAQTITLGTARQLRLTLQWDDPYDVTPVTVGAVVLQVPGVLSAATPQVDNQFSNSVVGKQYLVDVQGISNNLDPGGSLDVIVAIIQPDGTTLTTVDTGTSERFAFFATQTGAYTVRVTGFLNDTGTFTLTVNETSGLLSVTTDFNLLFFRVDTGGYLGCVCENNFATNRPVELPGTLVFPATAPTQVQMVISRATTPTAPTPARRLRYKMIASSNGSTGFPAEYFSYSTPVTYGHNSAAGANGVAAYSPFQPNIPEDFTSSGPVRIVWDRNNQRIPDDQQVRLKPNLAAMDGGNTTFFTNDTARDLDTFPNFFGTSAAAPTAASIAALVLQAKGGPGSVTPAQMRTMLQSSAFPHDLDPYGAGGFVLLGSHGTVKILAQGDNSTQARTDANAILVSYVGPSSISSITFDAANANPGGGNVSVPSTPGLVFDTRAAHTGQRFVVGSASVGLTSANVAATMLNQAPAPAVDGQFFSMRLDFTPNSFTSGKTLRFGVARNTFRSAFNPPTGDSRAAASGDLLGSNVRIPAGTTAIGGMSFTGILADGTPFSGTLTNSIGAGYSFLDGFGFINAQSAVSQPIPSP